MVCIGDWYGWTDISHPYDVYLMGHLLGGILATIGVDRLIGGYEAGQNGDMDFFGPTTGSAGWTCEW